MDRAVSNAGPLIHLAEIGEFELLKIFSKICIPEKVYEEVCIEGMPGEREVRSAENIEVLIVSKEEIEKVSNKVDLKLDDGELEALTVCNRFKVKIFLTDDLDARDAGKQLGFEVHGSIGVIARAYREGLIDLKRAKRASGDLYSISKLFVTKAIIEEAIKELEMF
jgi:predicted nucleic acid-binding protein